MDKNYQFINDLLEAIEIPDNGILTRPVHDDKHLKVVLFGFSEGQELSEHTAAVPAILHFIKGQAEVTLDGDRICIEPGSWLHMSPHLPHSVVAKTPMVMLLTMIKTAKNE